jgi:hypothetical protein
MIDLASETKIPLARVAAEIPPARGGRKTHISTVLRWITRGARAPDGTRVKLEAIRLGGRWFTTRQALARFAEALTPRLDSAPAAAPRPRSRRQRASDRAAAELERLGL